MEGTQKFNIQKIPFRDEKYPERLKFCGNMPEQLYLKGVFPENQKPTAAIVGARASSAYGRIQAFRYAREVSRAGVQIISGMAYGIDTEAHKGALEGGTPTFAVLGNGVDICYPAGNRQLYQRILRTGGGILSEYPEGTEARNYYFPLRNRIISGLADLVLIVEAREKSGSLITAQWALEQGKTVFALPGPVNEDLSRGCHKLIYDGAGIAYTPEVLLQELKINCKNKIKSPGKNDLVLARDLKLVYSCLDLRPKSTDYLIQKTGIPHETMGSILLELKLSGLIREIGRHHYIKEA